MARAYILSPKRSDAGTIIASTVVAGTAAVNVLRARPKLMWRSTDTTPYLEGNFGATNIPTVNTLFLGYVNSRDNAGLGSADTCRLRMASAQANLVAAPDFDSNTLLPSGIRLWPTGADFSAYYLHHRVWALPANQTRQYYRVDFSFGDNPLGYVQVGRAALGLRIEPAVSVQSKWSISGSEDVSETVDMGGEESARSSGTKRSITVTWHNLTESEKESLYTTLLERGSSKDIVVAIEDSEGIYAMSRVFVGRVKHVFSFQQTMMQRTNEHYFTVTLTVSELAPIQMV